MDNSSGGKPDGNIVFQLTICVCEIQLTIRGTRLLEQQKVVADLKSIHPTTWIVRLLEGFQAFELLKSSSCNVRPITDSDNSTIRNNVSFTPPPKTLLGKLLLDEKRP